LNTHLIESQLISVAIDANDLAFFSRLGVTREWFRSLPQAFDAYSDHVARFDSVPTATTLLRTEAEGVDHDGKRVTKSLEAWGLDLDVTYEEPSVLKRKLADANAKREIEQRLQALDSTRLSGAELAQEVASIAREVERKWAIGDDMNTNWTTNGAARFKTYEERESNKSALIPSGFREINRALTGKDDGAFVKGDYIVLYGMPKAAKSTLARAGITLPAARVGNRVLDLALENERFEIETLLDSMEAAYQHALGAITLGGVHVDAGFSRRKVAYGYMTASEKATYRDWTNRFATGGDLIGYGDYIVKTFEDSDMERVDLRKIESLIDEHKPDVVLIDQLSLCSYPKTGEQKNGAGAEAFSRSLRRMATRKQVVIVLVVQATYEDRKEGEDGVIQIRVPSLEDVKSTKAVIEDGVVTFGVDSHVDKTTKLGDAVIGVMMSRKGGAGTEVPIVFAPEYGVVRAFDDEAARQIAAAKAEGAF
jgi:hypothetical protein